MAREFGVRSYKPENVSFVASGSQPSGLPWSVVNRNIPKNILLQASNNPSTAEDLSMELGIALPYMEEEIEILRSATLLEKGEDGKYITNFFIHDKEGRLEIYHLLRQNAKERSRLLAELIEDLLHDIRGLDIAADHMSDNSLKWWLVPYITDYCLNHLEEDMSSYNPPVRANGETWGFVGYETAEFPEKTFVGHNGCGNKDAMMWCYKYSDYGLWDQCGEPDEWTIPVFLKELLQTGRKTDSFTAQEKTLWEKINGKYAHADENGTVIPDILILDREKAMPAFNRMLESHKHYPLLMESYRDTANKIRESLRRYTHKVLHNSLNYILHTELFNTRMLAVHDLVANGFLALPEDTSKSTLGMYLVI